MVDFSNNRSRFRGGLQPSRSLPMSTLNQRERTAPSAQRSVRQVRRVTSSQDNNALSPPSTPNPYTGRSEVKVRRTPQRAVSHSNPAARSRSRSSSPSKYDTTTTSSLLCPTSPTECLIPNKSRRRNSFGLVKAMIRALTLIVLGFAFGVVYNFYTTTALKAHIDVESIPAVVLTDELVKKLAHDNQLQEQEIDTLKHQVDEARHKAEREEEQQQNAADRKQQEPQKQDNPIATATATANANPGGGLRAVRRFTWDDAGNNVQEIPLDQGGESAAYFSPSGKSKDSHDNHHPAENENLLDSHHINNEEDHEFNRDNYEEEAMVHQLQQKQQQQAEIITAQAPPEPHDPPPPPKEGFYSGADEDHVQQQQTEPRNNNVDAQQREEYYHQEGHEDHPQHKQPSEDENQRHHPTEEQANVDKQQREEYYHQEGHQNSDQQQQQLQ